MNNKWNEDINKKMNDINDSMTIADTGCEESIDKVVEVKCNECMDTGMVRYGHEGCFQSPKVKPCLSCTTYV